ncbi:unnamed protein product, partial [Choristocarpus tenellus]
PEELLQTSPYDVPAAIAHNLAFLVVPSDHQLSVIPSHTSKSQAITHVNPFPEGTPDSLLLQVPPRSPSIIMGNHIVPLHTMHQHWQSQLAVLHQQRPRSAGSPLTP